MGHREVKVAGRCTRQSLMMISIMPEPRVETQVVSLPRTTEPGDENGVKSMNKDLSSVRLEGRVPVS